MNILITGSSGYVGTALIKQLTMNTNNKIIGYDIVSDPVDDICDTNRLEALIVDRSIDVIFHLAAIRSIAVCEDDSELAKQVNLVATVNLAKIASTLNVQLIFASTTAVNDSLRNIYASLKLQAENEMTFATIVRFSNIVGGIDGHPFKQQPPSLTENLTKAIKYNEVLSLHGNPSRNFVFIGDVVEKLISAMGQGRTLIKVTGLYNSDIKTYTEAFAILIKKPIVITHVPANDIDCPDLRESPLRELSYLSKIVNSYSAYFK